MRADRLRYAGFDFKGGELSVYYRARGCPPSRAGSRPGRTGCAWWWSRPGPGVSSRTSSCGSSPRNWSARDSARCRRRWPRPWGAPRFSPPGGFRAAGGCSTPPRCAPICGWTPCGSRPPANRCRTSRPCGSPGATGGSRWMISGWPASNTTFGPRGREPRRRVEPAGRRRGQSLRLQGVLARNRGRRRPRRPAADARRAVVGAAARGQPHHPRGVRQGPVAPRAARASRGPAGAARPHPDRDRSLGHHERRGVPRRRQLPVRAGSPRSAGRGPPRPVAVSRAHPGGARIARAGRGPAAHGRTSRGPGVLGGRRGSRRGDVLRPFPAKITHLRGTIRVAAERLEVRELAGQTGGGTVRLSGTMDWTRSPVGWTPNSTARVSWSRSRACSRPRATCTSGCTGISRT